MTSFKIIKQVSFTGLLIMWCKLLHASEVGQQYYKQQQFDLAEKTFVAYLNSADKQQRESPDYHQALITLSEILQTKQAAGSAVKYIEKALDIAPNNAEELILAGDIYCRHAQQVSVFSALGLGKKCIKQYEAAANNFPDNKKALTKAAQIHLHAPSFIGGSTKKAVEYLNQLQQLSEESARIIQVEYAEKIKDEKAAIVLAEKFALQRYADSENKYHLARFLKNKKRYELSKSLFVQVITEASNSSPDKQDQPWYQTDSLFQLGEIYLQQGKDIEKSIKFLEDYTQRNTEPTDQHYYWSRWYLAKAYYEVGDTEQYRQMVSAIKAQNYKQDDAFKDQFLEGVKQRKL